MSCSSCKESHNTFFKILYCIIFREKLCKCTTSKWCIYLCFHSNMAEHIRNVDTVHYSCKHTNLICLGSFHVLAGSSSPEITAANNNSNLHPIINDLLYLLCYF